MARRVRHLTLLGPAIMAATAAVLPETLPRPERRRGGLPAALRTMGELVHDRSFTGYLLTGSFGFAALFAYIAGSSFILQEVYGASPQTYSLLFGLNSLGMVATGQLNGKLLLGRFPSHRVLATGLTVLAAAGVAWVPSPRPSPVSGGSPPPSPEIAGVVRAEGRQDHPPPIRQRPQRCQVGRPFTGHGDAPRHGLRETGRAPPTTSGESKKVAGQSPFAAGSKIATHSTCDVIGNTSSECSLRLSEAKGSAFVAFGHHGPRPGPYAGRRRAPGLEVAGHGMVVQRGRGGEHRQPDGGQQRGGDGLPADGGIRDGEQGEQRGESAGDGADEGEPGQTAEDDREPDAEDRPRGEAQPHPPRIRHHEHPLQYCFPPLDITGMKKAPRGPQRHRREHCRIKGVGWLKWPRICWTIGTDISVRRRP